MAKDVKINQAASAAKKAGGGEKRDNLAK